MARIPSILPVVLLLAGSVAAGSAQAQQSYSYFQAALQTGTMSVVADPDHIGSYGGMIGYRFNSVIGIQAMGFKANNPFHQKLSPDGTALYDFYRYEGVQVVGYVPATSFWDIYGDLGVGVSHYTTAQAGFGTRTKTDGVVGAGLRYQLFPHFALGGDIQRVLDAQSTNASLRAEVDF